MRRLLVSDRCQATDQSDPATDRLLIRPDQAGGLQSRAIRPDGSGTSASTWKPPARNMASTAAMSIRLSGGRLTEVAQEPVRAVSVTGTPRPRVGSPLASSRQVATWCTKFS